MPTAFPESVTCGRRVRTVDRRWLPEPAHVTPGEQSGLDASKVGGWNQHGQAE